MLDSSAGRRRIVAEGDAAKVNAAFSVRLNNYRAPASLTRRLVPRQEGPPDTEPADEYVVYRGFEGPVRLPSELIGVVATVIGLDNRQLGHPWAPAPATRRTRITSRLPPSPSSMTSRIPAGRPDHRNH